METPAFCVVCGRFDRELRIRKSGLKCSECVGRRHNKGYAQLQQQQATYMLSKTANYMRSTSPDHMDHSPRSPRRSGASTIQPGRRTSFDLGATTGLIPPVRMGGGAGDATPRVGGGGVPKLQMPTQQPDHTVPVLGATGRQTSGQSAVTNASFSKSFASPKVSYGVPVEEINFDGLKLCICDAKTEEVEGGILKEQATIYKFRIDDEEGREVISTRHRFREVFRVCAALKVVGQHALPQLPEKKIIGRFDGAFIEQRKSEMERFINAALENPFLARHPQLLGLLSLEVALREQERLKSKAAATGGSATSRRQANNNNDAGSPRGPTFVPQYELDHCKLGTVIGKGSFGTVRLGLLPTSSQLVAAKVIRISSVHQNQINTLQDELDLLRTLHHPNVVHFLGVSWKAEAKELTFFTEYIECGSIASMVKRFGALPMSVIQRYMKQIVDGLTYLHALDVIHRDIKGENILVTKDGSVKLADFGCSTQLKELEVDTSEGAGVTGTPLWMAPEAMRGESQSFPADVWSVGCVGIEMLNRQPWVIGEKENVYTAMFRIQKHTGLPDGMPAEGQCDPSFRNFLLRCLNRDPTERASAADLLSDPFFTTDFTEGDSEASSPNVVPGSGLGDTFTSRRHVEEAEELDLEDEPQEEFDII